MSAYQLLVVISAFYSFLLQANHVYQAELRYIEECGGSLSPAQQQIQNLNANFIKQVADQHAQQALRATQVNHENHGYYPALASFYNYHQQDLYSVVYKWWNDTPSVGYFGDKFDHLPSIEVFHQFYHYQDPGFCQYVQTRDGWNEFLEGIGPTLSENSELTQLLRSKSPPSLSALQRLYRDQQQRREAEKQVACRQMQIQQLKQLDFNDNRNLKLKYE